MKTALAVAGVALALSACASAGEASSASSAPAPIESASSSGEVAAALSPVCDGSPPAKGVFGVDGDAEHDGVVGVLRNQTDYWVLMTSNRSRVQNAADRCYLAPGGSLAYAGNYYVTLYLQRDTSNGRDVSPGSFATHSDQVNLDDPDYGDPTVRLGMGLRFYDDECLVTETKGRQIRQGQSMDVGTISAGSISATRLSDDKNATRAWSGRDSWAVNDWARIDLVLTSDKRCS